MTHEERATWIRRIFFVFLALAVVAGVWLYPKPKAPVTTRPHEVIQYDLEITHYHQPGNPESEKIAESLAKIGKKYERIVLIQSVDITANPQAAKANGVKKAPSVIMMAGKQRAFAFQGPWPQPQIERKVEEILRGLKAVGKDWRPDVKGLKPDANLPPTNPSPPQQKTSQ
jgi:hypothetical protein